MRRDSRGFTLVEMLMVTVLGALVLAAALQVLITNQRTYTAQTATITGQQSTRIALEVLFAELRQLSPQGGDIQMMHSDSLRVRMMRKFSRACDVGSLMTATPSMIVMDLGPVDFVAGVNPDSVFVYADKRQNDDDDDIWIPAQVTAVAATVCPQVPPVTIPPTLPTPGLRLTFGGQQNQFDVPDSVHVGAPVRSFTTVRFALVTYAGDQYLGRAEGSAALQPVAGPLLPDTGLEFVYRDALGAVTTTAADVRQIVVRIRSESTVLNSLGEMVSDSVTAWVYTRN
jgi:prepilin-type N-terminal cleavage/methylation domain-containing protein